MPSNYTGSPAAITARQVPVISCPVDADALSAASANAPTQKLADILAWLQANAAELGVENDFTALNAIVLSRVGNQAIAKSGAGVLSIASSVNDVLINAAAGHNAILAVSAGASLTASDTALTANKPLAMGSNPITGVVDPTNPQDAATQHYVDASVSAEATNRAIGVSAEATSRAIGDSELSRRLSPNYLTLPIASTWTGSNAMIVQCSRDGVQWSQLRGVVTAGASPSLAFATMPSMHGPLCDHWFAAVNPTDNTLHPVHYSYGNQAFEAPGATAGLRLDLSSIGFFQM